MRQHTCNALRVITGPRDTWAVSTRAGEREAGVDLRWPKELQAVPDKLVSYRIISYHIV